MNFKQNSHALLMNFLQHSSGLQQSYRLLTLFGYGPLSQKFGNLLKLFFVATDVEKDSKIIISSFVNVTPGACLIKLSYMLCLKLGVIR